jgi:hypothetical protein
METLLLVIRAWEEDTYITRSSSFSICLATTHRHARVSVFGNEPSRGRTYATCMCCLLFSTHVWTNMNGCIEAKPFCNSGYWIWRMEVRLWSLHVCFASCIFVSYSIRTIHLSLCSYKIEVDPLRETQHTTIHNLCACHSVWEMCTVVREFCHPALWCALQAEAVSL